MHCVLKTSIRSILTQRICDKRFYAKTYKINVTITLVVWFLDTRCILKTFEPELFLFYYFMDVCQRSIVQTSLLSSQMLIGVIVMRGRQVDLDCFISKQAITNIYYWKTLYSNFEIGLESNSLRKCFVKDYVRIQQHRMFTSVIKIQTYVCCSIS